jgi:predicted RNase H-like HicB family nuclease
LIWINTPGAPRAEGDTPEDARERAAAAIRCYLESLRQGLLFMGIPEDFS